MDGLIGLIIFAVISFVYNKVMEKQNAQNGEGGDLSQWVEEVEAEQVQEEPPLEQAKKQAPMEQVEKKPIESLAQKLEKNENIPAPRKTEAPLSNLFATNTLSQEKYRTVHLKDSQTSYKQTLKKNKTNKRHSLNYKNRKTLRQAFILNTVLSKAKAYEP